MQSGGVANTPSVTSGGALDIDAFGSASGAIISSGGTETVSFGGIDRGASISGGEQDVYGLASGTTVYAGSQVVESGGTANQLIVSSGGTLDVSAGGTVNDLSISGALNVLGTVTSNVSVFKGGVVTVSSGGVVSGAPSSGTAVSAGGKVNVLSGGTFAFFVVSSGGITTVSAGGSAHNLSVDGTLNVFGTITTEATVFSGGILNVSSGGVANTVVVSAGGRVNVAAHATTFDDVLSGSSPTSGVEVVSAGGVSDENLVSGGGKLILSGGTAFNTDVNSGGLLVISAGGRASGTRASGIVVVSNGGVNDAAILAEGGGLSASSGGTALDAIAEGGGKIVVSSGGSATSPLIAGGTLELQAGAVVHGAIAFAGTGGTLKIDAVSSAAMPSNTISGFVSGNVIDLTAVTYAAGAAATLLSGDTLQVTDGGVNYDLQLLTAQNFNGATFRVGFDGASGTEVTANQPIAITGETVANVQTVALVSASGNLSASDANPGAQVTWAIVGGTSPHAPNYQFAIDEFQVTSGGTVEFTDNFASPNPPSFSDGETASYTLIGGTISNTGSQDLLLGTNAGLINANANFDGQTAVLNTDTSSSGLTDALYSGTSFTVGGTFDLVLPADSRSAYGIQLTDAGGGDGHDIVRLEVTRNIYDQLQVQLQQVDNVTGSTDVLQAINLSSAGDNQIELQLSNNGTFGNGSITASFTLLDNGVVDTSQSFTFTGSVFVPENGVAENWTQPAFFAAAPAISDSVLTGTYGTLVLEQNGTWNYELNTPPNGQALTESQSATDTFQVEASDASGDSTVTPFTVEVAGDTPTLSVTVAGTTGEGVPVDGAQAFNQFLAFGDSGIDSGYFLYTPISTDPTKEALYQASAAAGGGIPTSLGGTMNSTLLAQDFGLTAIPSDAPGGGTNYAASGATVSGALSGSLAPSMDTQITNYLLATGGHADPNGIYLITGGGNDEKIAENLDPVFGQDYMIASAINLANEIDALYVAGARYIVLEPSASGPLGTVYTSALQQTLVTLGVPFISASEGTGVLAPVEADPAAYGITDPDMPPKGPFTGTNAYNPGDTGADVNPSPSTITNSWSLYATQLSAPDSGQTDLWSDDEHLSAAGQAIEANYLYQLIENAAPTVGETLTASPLLAGSTSSTANVTYQWQSQALGQTTWTNISGATGLTYVVQPGDLGALLRVQASFTDPGTGLLLTADSPATLAVDPAVLTWASGVSGDWSTSMNWSGGAVPSSGDVVSLFDLATNNPVAITISNPQSAAMVTINDAGTTVTVADGGSLTLGGELALDAGDFVVQSGGNVTASGGIFVEGASPGNFAGGMLTVEGTLTTPVVDRGTLVVEGTTVDATLIATGGIEFVSLGGLAKDTTVSSGGQLEVLSGGSADPTVIYAGGSETIAAIGADTGALISGGMQDVFGSAIGATVFAGSQVVESDGIASSTVVSSGGFQYLNSGSEANNTTIAGGTMDLVSGAVVSGPITFTGTGGTLKIEDTTMPTNVISGFAAGDTIDLVNVGYDSGGSADPEPGDILQITENNSTYDLQLAGNYMGDTFSLSGDIGGTGTDVTMSTPCYCPGTLIRTSRGQTRVQRLKIGDMVKTCRARCGRSNGSAGAAMAAASSSAAATSCRSASRPARSGTHRRAATFGSRRSMRCISTAC